MSAAKTNKDGDLEITGNLKLATGKVVKINDVTQRTAAQMALVAAVAGTTPAGGSGATAGAYDTAENRDALIATVAEIKASLNDLIAKMKTAGYIASA